MKRIIAGPLFILFLLGAAPALLFSGQIHVTYFGLADAWQASGQAVLATVAGDINSRNAFPYTVDKLWRSPSPVSFKLMRALKQGERRRGKLYTGLVWTNPDESPVDNLLWGHLTSGSIFRGGRVILFPKGPNLFWAMPVTDDIIRKLDALEKEGNLRSLLEGATDSSLLEALSDIDLWGDAVRRLEEKGMLSPYVLLTNRLPSENTSLARHYAEGLAPAERESFFLSCGRQMHLLPESARREVLTMLINNSGNVSGKETAVFLKFLSKLDLSLPANLDQYGYYLAVLDELQFSMAVSGEMDSSLLPRPGDFAKNLSFYTENREPYASYEDAIESITGKLPRAERTILVSLLFGSISGTPFSDYYLGNCDAFLLKICLDWAIREPSPAYMPGIASIPLKDFKDKTSCRETAARMLSAAAA
ncbi:MAG: hypothetical protein E4H36_10585, partial [Spirochaetales bacterium]